MTRLGSKAPQPRLLVVRPVEDRRNFMAMLGEMQCGNGRLSLWFSSLDTHAPFPAVAAKYFDVSEAIFTRAQ